MKFVQEFHLVVDAFKFFYIFDDDEIFFKKIDIFD